MKFIIAFALIVTFASCMRGMTPQQAARGPQKCGRGYIR